MGEQSPFYLLLTWCSCCCIILMKGGLNYEQVKRKQVEVKANTN